MERYSKGNAVAFELLYKRHKDPLYRFVLRQVSDRALTEEIFQDIWSKVIESRERYEAKAKFTTWLYTIARNRVIDHARSESKKSEVLISAKNEDTSGEVSDNSFQPDLLLENEKSKHALMQTIALLPATQKEALLLKYEGGFNHAAIAEITGEKEETIKSQVRYALNKIKKTLFGGANVNG